MPKSISGMKQKYFLQFIKLRHSIVSSSLGFWSVFCVVSSHRLFVSTTALRMLVDSVEVGDDDRNRKSDD